MMYQKQSPPRGDNSKAALQGFKDREDAETYIHSLAASTNGPNAAMQQLRRDYLAVKASRDGPPTA